MEEGLGAGAGKGMEPVFNNHLNKMQSKCPGAHLAFDDQSKPRRADPMASEG